MLCIACILQSRCVFPKGSSTLSQRPHLYFNNQDGKRVSIAPLIYRQFLLFFPLGKANHLLRLLISLSVSERYNNVYECEKGFVFLHFTSLSLTYCLLTCSLIPLERALLCPHLSFCVKLSIPIQYPRSFANLIRAWERILYVRLLCTRQVHFITTAS